jgi:uncharacterized repeat protein (TIGR03843 family)
VPAQQRSPRQLSPTVGTGEPTEPGRRQTSGSSLGDRDELVDLLVTGDVELQGRMPWSSNATFLVEVSGGDGRATLGVYKPTRGERPLWDFPRGLGRREVAAWLVSEALGWGLVPVTVLRDGPLGEGSVQQFVPADFEQHYFSLYDDPATHDALRAICAFDLVVNNTDRKSGHCLLGEDGRIYAIDNGLAFSVEPKLRTVIWEFAGEPLPGRLVADVAALADSPPPGLFALIDVDEVEALADRAAALAADPVFPEDPTGQHYPWPLV